MIKARFFIVSALVLIAGSFSSSLRAQEKEENQDYIVARIGDEDVYFSEIEMSAAGLNRFLKENFQQSFDWHLNFIRNAIAGRVLAKRAEGIGMLEEPDVKFQVEEAKRNILSQKLIGDILDKLNISEEDIVRYYEENKEKYEISPRIKISYIKVQREKDLKYALKQVKKGTDFKSLINKISSRNEAAGGDEEIWISKDAPFIEGIDAENFDINVLFDMELQSASEPIKIGDFNYIFRVDEKEPARAKTFEEVRRQVEFEYLRKARDEAINKLVLQSMRDEKVEIFEDAVKREFEKKKK